MSKRSSKVKKQMYIFTISLTLVLIIGLLAMLGYSAFLKSSVNDDKVQKEQHTIDFSEGYQVYEADNIKNTESISDEVEKTVDERLTVNEVLYNEALEKNQNAYIMDCAQSDKVTLGFAGDILLDDEYAMMYKFRLRGGNIDDTFSSELMEKMRSVDIFMINNEFPFSDRGTPTEGKKFTFRAAPSNINIYREIGVDVVSLANNHAYDYGEQALLDTFSVLEAENIPYVGAGENIDEAKKPVYLIANGIKIAIVSATQIERNGNPDTKEATSDRAGVLRCMDPSVLLEVIKEAKQNSDFVVLYIHWGTESQETTDWLQDKQAPIYAQEGVDLIIGDHPHCLQKLDTVNGVPVAYSLGNFWFNSKTQNTCFVEIAVNKEGLEYFKFIPCIQEDCRTRLLTGGEKEGVLNYMRGLSPNVIIDDEGYVTFK